MAKYLITEQDLFTLQNLFRNLDQKLELLITENKNEISKVVTETFNYSNPDFEIKILGENLLVGEVLIALTTRKVTLRLIKSLVDSDGETLSRKELVELVYDVDYSKLSNRMRMALDKNIMKLISRTRTLLESSLAGSSYASINWLVYSEKQKGWYFYK